MSNNKTLTVYDNITGKLLVGGNENSKKVADLVAAGHISVEGKYDNKTIWDFATSTVVPDNDKIQEEIDYGNEVEANTIRKGEILTRLEEIYDSPSDSAENINLLSEFLRL